MKIVIVGATKGDQLATINAIKESELLDVDIIVSDVQHINKGFDPDPFELTEVKHYEDFPVSKNGKGKKLKSWEKKKYM